MKESEMISEWIHFLTLLLVAGGEEVSDLAGTSVPRRCNVTKTRDAERETGGGEADKSGVGRESKRKKRVSRASAFDGAGEYADFSHELSSRLICEGALPFASWVTSRARMRESIEEDWSHSGASSLGKLCLSLLSLFVSFQMYSNTTPPHRLLDVECIGR